MTRTVAEALRYARARGLDALDAQVLLAKSLDRQRTWVLAFDDACIEPGRFDAFAALVARRATGEPLAYLTGEKEFCGLALHVGPAVLVPRPETEHLVQWGLEVLREPFADTPCASVLDLGTGSGAIALALKAARPQAQVEASDLDPAALQMAERNANRLGLEVRFHLGNWWGAVPGRAFNLALCNPPYIAGADPHLAALGNEPATALTPGTTGIEALQTVIEGAAAHLHAAGWLLLEHGFDQAAAVTGLMQRHGFTRIQTRADLAGLPRCTGGSRQAA